MTDVRDTECLVARPRGGISQFMEIFWLERGIVSARYGSDLHDKRMVDYPKSTIAARSHFLHDTSSMFAMDKHT